MAYKFYGMLFYCSTLKFDNFSILCVLFSQNQPSYKTVNVVTQEVFERLVPKAPKKVNQVPPPPPPSLSVDHFTEVMESTERKVIHF